jgi:SAM-dependent methyltransferase
MDRSDIQSATDANRAAWDASAHLHGQGRDWEALLAAAAQPDFSVLDACITETLKSVGVSGRRAAQVGCNNARELLSLASLGADPALGIDQSTRFLAQGALLAKAAGLNPRLLAANIYDLPQDVGQYDLILITIGVLNWMPDLRRFFGIVAGLMAPDAVLVIYETHPFLEVFDPDAARPFEPSASYFERRPVELNRAITYDGSDGGTGATGYWFIHTLGEIVTACVQSGLKLQALTEHPHLNREVDYAVYENQAAQIPLSFTLVACV